MKKETFFRMTEKVVVSGIFAFILLTLFCFFYYNIPIHTASLDGATDYKWEPYSFYCRATEGFSLGRINNDGYVNAFDYDGASVEVLLMGSSQMEGLMVTMDKTVSSKLNARFGHNAVYSIGISGHSFLTCVGNLEAAIAKYRPKRVILETGTLSFSAEALRDAINAETKEVPSHSSKFARLLQRNQYLRLLYAQFKNYRNSKRETVSATPTVTDAELLDQVLQNISRTAQAGETELLILYHPSTVLDADGQLVFSDNSDEVRQFSKSCEKHGITFLDTRERFRAAYENEHILPYGFPNSTVGSGHLNRFGCDMIAEELYQVIGGG